MQTARLMLILFVAAVLLAGCTRKVSSDERELFVTGPDLRQVDCNTDDGTGRSAGKFNKRHVPFMYDSLDYKLNATGKSVDCKVVIAGTITIARDVSTAEGMYKGGARGAQIGLNMTHIKFANAKDSYHYGDQSEYFNLVKHERIIGFYFQTRIGRVVYQYLVFGLRFGTAHAFEKLFRPKLDRVRSRYQTQT